jgi:hypothetical protein
MITATSEPDADRLVADDAHQAGQAKQRDQRGEQGEEPVVGQAAGRHRAPVGLELLHGAHECVLPAGSAEFKRRFRAAFDPAQLTHDPVPLLPGRQDGLPGVAGF